MLVWGQIVLHKKTPLIGVKKTGAYVTPVNIVVLLILGEEV